MKRIVLILIGLLLIVAIFSGGFFYSNYLVKRNQSIGEAQNAQYEKEFIEVTSLIADNSGFSMAILDGTASAWSRAIEVGSEYIDFNTAIENYLEARKDSLAEMNKRDDLITSGMQKLKNYPIQYQEAYNVLLEVHGVYSQLYALAQSPTGSLMSFNNRVNDLTSEFTRVVSKLKIYMPKVKELPESVAPNEEPATSSNKSGGVAEASPAKVKQNEGSEHNERICEKCGKEMKIFESNGQLTIEHNCNNPQGNTSDAITSSSTSQVSATGPDIQNEPTDEELRKEIKDAFFDKNGRPPDEEFIEREIKFIRKYGESGLKLTYSKKVEEYMRKLKEEKSNS